MISDFFNHMLSIRQSLLEPPCNRQIQQPQRFYLHDQKRIQSGQMMRVNHIGELCAQALYIGQIRMASNPDLREALIAAKNEEIDHLAWCKNALTHLHASPSFLIYIWFSGALIMSLCISLLGDTTSAGFLAETEHQVAKHLKNHLSKIAMSDTASIAILNRMLAEELAHAETANEHGAEALPNILIDWMQLNGRLMTTLGLYC